MKPTIIYLLACFLAIPSFLEAQDLANINGYYWIDNDKPQEFSGSTFNVPTDKYQDGVHFINVIACANDKDVSIPRSTSFTKTSTTGLKGLCVIDGNMQSPLHLFENSNGIYSVDLDANNLQEGIHNLQFMCLTEGNTVSECHSAWFFRSPNNTEYKDAKIVFFLDGKKSGVSKLNAAQNLYMIDIDTDSLCTGIHSIDFFVTLKGGIVSKSVKCWFYKTPVPQGIVQYEYWFDNRYEDAVKIKLDAAMRDLELIKMIDVPTLQFDSKNYAFSFVDEKPVINGVNSFTMRFTESDGRSALSQSEFLNSQYEYPLTEIKELINGTNKIPKPAENNITLLKFDGEIGDSIALRFDSPLYCELYSPSAKRVIRNKGSQSESLTTLTLKENGTFYLAVHDVASRTSDAINLEFVHIPRNAILKVTPSISTSSSLFTSVNIIGNGMLNVEKVTLIGANGTTYDDMVPFAYDNYNLSACFKHDEPLSHGAYDLMITFSDPLIDESVTLTKKDALSIIDGENANVKVNVIPSKKASTPYMVEISIVNDSDVPCWGIPFNIACERDGGKNGFVFYMSDIVANNQYSLDNIKWYESDNILGTGVDGLYFPLLLDHMAPHEERRMRVGITSEPHAHVGLYAWAGQPLSEEIPVFLSSLSDTIPEITVYQTNIINFESIAYMINALSEIIENKNGSSPAKAPSEDDWVLRCLLEFGPDVFGRLPGMERSAKFANIAAHLHIAVGQTIADIVNHGPCRNSYEKLKDAGVPGDNLLEQLYYFYIFYPTERHDEKWEPILDQAERNLARIVAPQDIVKEALAGLDLPDYSDEIIDCIFEKGMNCPNKMPIRHDIYCMQSRDPNLMSGYTDPAGGNFVGIGIKQLEYKIEFENDSTIATAPASTIIVKNHLNKDIFNLSSFSSSKLSIGAHEIVLPNENNFVITEDMRPEINCIAEIRQEYSEETGDVIWSFRSLDPITLEEVDNFRQGLLPVNDNTNAGAGSITYTVELLDNLPHMTSIENKATIIFDDNEAIDTPTYLNITDYEMPHSSIIKGYGYKDGCYSFDVETTDNGSGVMKYDLYYRTKESDNWYVILSSLIDEHVELPVPEPIEGIQFMVKATDCAGNIEADNYSRPDDSVKEITTYKAEDSPVEWFNLQGLKIDSKKVAKGIYIRRQGSNVRKILIK